MPLNKLGMCEHSYKKSSKIFIKNKSESDRRLSFFKRFYERLIKIRGQPREIALGFALGIFIGMSPTMGIQTPIAIFLASIFKWNKISAAIGVWITNPITAPIIYSFTYFIGASILGIRGGGNVSNSMEPSFTLFSRAPDILWSLIIGGLIIGIPLTVAAYYICFSAVQKYQDNIKRQIAKQKERIATIKEERRKRKKSLEIFHDKAQ